MKFIGIARLDDNAMSRFRLKAGRLAITKISSDEWYSIFNKIDKHRSRGSWKDLVLKRHLGKRFRFQSSSCPSFLVEACGDFDAAPTHTFSARFSTRGWIWCVGLPRE